jgi:hypothetical protein
MPDNQSAKNKRAFNVPKEGIKKGMIRVLTKITNQVIIQLSLEKVRKRECILRMSY